MEAILQAYGLTIDHSHVEKYGSGLVNQTWKITTTSKEYILQRVNDKVFIDPPAIATNISLIGDYLEKNYPGYAFIHPIKSTTGDDIVYSEENGYFRMFPFVSGSHSINVVKNPHQAFEAARQFGKFTRLLSGININKINITIPRFHDLTWRYKHFLSIVETANKERIAAATEVRRDLENNYDIVEDFEKIKKNPAFKLRVTHHDTKISNVLFNAEGFGLCVIDLDTVMPGYFISDVGDMIRTYLSPVSEEENDFSKITLREEIYTAIVTGYLSEMKEELTEIEKSCFYYAGRFSVYMQAIRFITDYLNNDSYYGASYPEQNLIRAKNQLVLLQKLNETNLVLINSDYKAVS